MTRPPLRFDTPRGRPAKHCVPPAIYQAGKRDAPVNHDIDRLTYRATGSGTQLIAGCLLHCGRAQRSHGPKCPTATEGAGNHGSPIRSLEILTRVRCGSIARQLIALVGLAHELRSYDSALRGRTP
ncbi:hypothetical protein BHM03_00011443 [Ensete ventricosum]|nr:hypothetical protein BHM03_00011443 [Ensete ventricosum]